MQPREKYFPFSVAEALRRPQSGLHFLAPDSYRDADSLFLAGTPLTTAAFFFKLHLIFELCAYCSSIHEAVQLNVCTHFIQQLVSSQHFFRHRLYTRNKFPVKD